MPPEVDVAGELDSEIPLAEFGWIELSAGGLGLLVFMILLLRAPVLVPRWKRGALAMHRRRVRLPDLGILLLGFFVIPILLSAFIGSFIGLIPGIDFDLVEDPGGLEELGFLMGMTLFQQLCILVASFWLPGVRHGWLWVPRPQGWVRFFGFNESGPLRWLGLAGLYFFLSLPLVIGSLWLVDVVYQGLGIEYAAQDQVQFLANSEVLWLQLLMVFVTVLGAPVAEEIVFRGVLLPLFVRWVGVIPAILLNGLVFGIIHMHLPTVLPLSLLGMLLAGSYIYSRSLAVPILVHLIFNGVNTWMLLAG